MGVSIMKKKEQLGDKCEYNVKKILQWVAVTLLIAIQFIRS
jgi:hypothetical protein